MANGVRISFWRFHSSRSCSATSTHFAYCLAFGHVRPLPRCSCRSSCGCSFSGVQRLEVNLHVFTLGTEKTIARVSTDIKGLEERAQAVPKNLLDFQPGLSRTRLEADRSRLQGLQKAQSVLRPLHVFLECLNYAVPKTVDTNNLLDRWLARADDLPSDDDSGPSGPDFFDIDSRDLRAATRETVAGQRRQTIQSQPLSGSSGRRRMQCCSLSTKWIFCRRDKTIDHMPLRVVRSSHSSPL